MLWSPRIQKPHRVSTDWFYVTDWLPTLLSAAGIDADLTNLIDGMDQWPTLSRGTPSPRREVPLNIDEKFHYGALISDGFKLINGTTFGGWFDQWMGVQDSNEFETGQDYNEAVLSSTAARVLSRYGRNNDDDFARVANNLRAMARVQCGRRGVGNPCNALMSPCLFDLNEDPCEQNNLAEQEPERLRDMLKRLYDLYRHRAPLRNVRGDPNADPARFNGTWTWWTEPSPQDFFDLKQSEIKVKEFLAK